MSAELLRAVRDQLCRKLSLDAGDCAVQLDGRPPPMSGKVFYSVARSSKRANSIDNALDQTMGVVVTVSYRISEFPIDVHGEELILRATQGLEALEDSVISAIHNRYEIIAAADALVPENGSGYLTGHCLKWESSGPYQPQSGDWWFSDDPNAAVCGLSFDVYFGGARRIRAMGDLK